ncbi:type II secretion system F family protein [Burkholderia contaminans]|uniref:type II secretion system F family protein n=1 Tax=Burkholderia contaminans TaxID=488447 RepID=UPI001F1336A2|nr:type II secretion system F family protein [Burkholderia contaminans]UMY33535.1 type II secretion system F family protein [Burkholderia contaminans]
MKRAKLSWGRRRTLYDIAEGLLSEDKSGKKGAKKLVDILRDYRQSLLRRDADNWFRRLLGLDRKAAVAVEQVEKAVRTGRSFTTALGPSLGPMERTILGSGERSSNLDGAMRLVRDLREMLAEIQWQLASSMSQPIVYLVATYGFLLVLGGYVVPKYSTFYPAEKWTGWASVMLSLSKAATGWAPFVAGGTFIGLIGLIVWALPRWSGRGRTFADSYLFPFSSYAYVNGTAWLLTFAVLLRSGVNDKRALSEQMQFGSPWLTSRLKPIRDGIVGGKSLSTAMHDAKTNFPSYELIEAIRAREEADDFPERIEALARKEMERMKRRFVVRSVLWGLFMFVVLMGVVFILQLGVNDLTADSASAVGTF